MIFIKTIEMGNCMGVCCDGDSGRKSVHELQMQEALRRNEDMAGTSISKRSSLRLLPTDQMANACVVIDQGAGNLRAGFAGEYEPRVKFPNIFAAIEEGEKRG